MKIPGYSLPFVKMTGSGNDFIIIDNRSGLITPRDYSRLARKICQRKRSVGADGLIFLENDSHTDFAWHLFNPDGTEAEMCGNGARCIARYAWLFGVVSQPRMWFRTPAGIIEAAVQGDSVKTKLTPPSELETDLVVHTNGRTWRAHHINTGVPHVVIFMENEMTLKQMDVISWGRLLRHHPCFEPAGTNVNFAYVVNEHCVMNRTYERGVETETLACGTGSAASALVAAACNRAMTPPIEVHTLGGEVLTIHFKKGNGRFSEVYLEGDAKVIYEGKLWIES